MASSSSVPVADPSAQLAAQLGFRFNQNRFQRTFGPSVTTPANFHPPEGSEVYVSQLPRNVLEPELYELFSVPGKIHQIRLMMSDEHFNLSPLTRGFAFVMYQSPLDAEKAVDFMDGWKLNGCSIKVSRSMDNKRLFIGGIEVTRTRDEIWKELIKQGMHNVVDVIMYRSYTNRHHNRGFIFVEFPTHKEAAIARRKFRQLTLFGQKLVIDWSVPIPDISEQEMAQVKNLFLRNLSVSLSREELAEKLSAVIDLKYVEKIYKFKDYAFVNFTTREYAERSLYVISEYMKDSLVEVMWAKPPGYYTRPKTRNVLVRNILSNHSKPKRDTKPQEVQKPQPEDIVSMLSNLGINYFF